MSLTEADKALRLTGIGGSDIGAICGLSKYRRPIDVWREKRGLGEPFDGNRFTEWGEILEPVVADVYAAKHGAVLAGPFPSVRTGVAPWHVISVDRIELKNRLIAKGSSVLEHRGHITRLIEIKTANWYGGRAFGVEGSDDLPQAYLAQIAWYQAGLDVDHATCAALINTSDYREYHIERDRELEGYLLERGEAFWKLVESGTEPEPDGSDQFKRYLQQRFDKTVELTAPSSPDIEAITFKLRQAKVLHRELEKTIELMKQQLQHHIGECTAVETEHGKLTFKFDARGRVNWEDVARELWESDDRILGDSIEDLADVNRYNAPRRFLTPHAWRKDELSAPIVDLLEGNHDDD